MTKAVDDMLNEEKSNNERSEFRARRAATMKQDIERKYKTQLQINDHKHQEMARKMMKKTLK